MLFTDTSISPAFITIIENVCEVLEHPIMFALYLFTGYGHIAPKTANGRITTIFYAVVGIPLTLLCLTNIGRVLADIFRFLYKRVCCMCCSTCDEYALSTRIRQHCREISTHDFSCHLPMSGTEAKTLHERMPYGDGENDTFTLTSNFYDVQEEKNHDHTMSSLNTEAHEPISRHGEMSDNRIHEKITVPISLTLSLMAGYVCSGATLFALWEEEWDYLIGSYFVFVTLSTIGFGDFVPGDNNGSWSSQEKQILCTMYLMFGLAFVAMCFELMQEEVRNKFRRLGRKIGLFSTS